MGIININDDSFSGDGSLDIQASIDTAIGMVRDGAAIIDVGAESARTNREAIAISEEIARLTPFLQQLPASLKMEGLPMPAISVNSWRPEVIEAVLPLGVDLINDIGGLPDGDDRNARLAARFRAQLLIMHTVGAPKVAHTGQQWENVVASMLAFFREKIAVAEAAGLARDQIVIDPGIDFAKQRDDNLLIYQQLSRFTQEFGCPLLLPISRKTVIGDVLDLPNAQDRDAGTIACLVSGMLRGASIVRVHNVRAVSQALHVVEPLLA